jgi:transcriptional regulator with XRE-family HTH domain
MRERNRQIACKWGDNIRKARGDEPVRDLARRLRVSPAAVYKWESGDAIPTPAMQLRIAAALGRPHVVLFNLEQVALGEVA